MAVYLSVRLGRDMTQVLTAIDIKQIAHSEVWVDAPSPVTSFLLLASARSR
jgi:hypothetical protein